jgi:nucleotide-binding universal stress UspA family protein
MKRILVPTDFSILGEFAYNIAQKIATKMNAEICVLYVVVGPQDGFYTKEGLLQEDNERDYSKWNGDAKEAELKLNKWLEGKPSNVSSKTVIGNINTVISSYAEQDHMDMIVMGTSGINSHSWFAHSSHTEFMVNHSQIPILSLKCDRSSLDLHKIVLVGEFSPNETMDLSILTKIQDVFDSEIVMLEVATEKERRTNEQIIDSMELFAAAHGLKKHSTHIYKSKSVEAGIAAFSAEKHIDLIAIGTHQRSGVSKLFKESISDDIVSNLFHPILTFPIA